MNKKPLVILTGPTAIGKTNLSILLAKALDGEIISADSMQVYKEMNIGTAKITKDEQQGVLHHLIDYIEPEEDYNIARFKEDASKSIEECYRRGHLPIIVGGTGFYIQSVLYDVDFSKGNAQTDIRNTLQKVYEEKGEAFLHAQLQLVDPESASIIHANNVKRVIRALEYYMETNEKISTHNAREREKPPAYQCLYYVLTASDRNILYERIDKRVDEMIKAGLVDEVKQLKKRGLNKHHISMKGLGYKEILTYLDGECTLEEAIYTLKRDTRHFAKRQFTWFQREKNVRFIDKEAFDMDDLLVSEFLIKDIKERLLGKTNEAT